MSLAPTLAEKALLAVAVAGALLAPIQLLMRKPATPDACGADAPPQPWPWIAASVLLYAFLAVTAAVGQPMLISADEYCRTTFAFNWSAAPYFAPPDHIWLSGQFYVLGGLHRLLPDMPFWVAVTSFLGNAVLAMLLAMLAIALWPRRPAAGFFASALATSNVVILWGSFNAVAEVFSLPLLVLGILCLVMGEGAGPDEDARCPDVWRFAAACAIGLGTMFRFELWFAGILLGGWLGALAVRAVVTKERWRAILLRVAGCAVLMAYPMAWMGSSWMTLGSPFRFASDASTMNMETNRAYDFSTGLAKLLVYPKSIWIDHGWSTLIGLVGVAAVLVLLAAGTWRRGGESGAPTHAASSMHRRRAMVLLAIVAGLWAVSMLVSMKTGIGSNHRPRYTVFLLLPLLALAAGPLAAFHGAWRAGGFGQIARGATLALLLAHCMASAMDARFTYPNAWGVSPGILALAEHLALEGAEHRWASAKLWPAGVPLLVHHRGHPDDFWILRFHSRRPFEMESLWKDEHLDSLAREGAPGVRLAMRNDPPLERPMPDLFKQVGVVGIYTVYEIAPPEPLPPTQETAPSPEVGDAAAATE